MPVIALQSFAGLWTDHEHALIPPNTFREANNVVYTAVSRGRIIVRGRRGRIGFNTSFGANTRVVTLHRFYKRDGTKSTLAMYDDNTNIRARYDDNDDGGFSTPTGTSNFPTGKLWNWVTFPSLSAAYGVNGESGLYKFDHAAATQLASVTITGVQVKGPHATIWRDRLWCDHTDGLLYASNANDPTNFSASNALQFPDPQGGNIVGVVGLGDVLVVLRDTGLWRFTGDIATLAAADLVKYSTTPCIAPRSIARTPYGVMFVSDDGVYLTDGFVVSENIARPLRNLFVDTRRLNAVGGYDVRNQQYWLRLEPTDTSTLVAHRVELGPVAPPSGGILRDAQGNVQRLAPSLTPRGVVWLWSKYTNTVHESSMSWSGVMDDGRFLVGDRNGRIWVADSGLLDDDTAYELALVTSSFPLGSTYDVGRVEQVGVQYRSIPKCSVGIRYDESMADNILLSVGSTGAVTPRTVVGWREVSDMTKEGNRVALSLQLIQQVGRAELYGITLVTRISSPHRKVMQI